MYTKEDINVYVYRKYIVKTIVRKCLENELMTLQDMYFRFEEELELSKDCKKPKKLECILGEIYIKQAYEVIKDLDATSLKRLGEISAGFDVDNTLFFWDKRYGAKQTAAQCLHMRPETYMTVLGKYEVK